MTDTVLQSFCERCGTRYTFTEQEQKPEDSRSKLGRLGRRTGPETPAEQSISTALPSSERFDGTFHFCLECRQYACENCWNSDAGYCVGCRPPGSLSGTVERPPVPIRAPATGGSARAHDVADAPSAWPSDDLQRRGTTDPDTHVPNSPGPALTATRVDGDAPASAAGSEQRTLFQRSPDPVDEWGRPLAEQPARKPGPVDSDLPFDTSSPAADPWQDVVFSEGGETDRTAVPTSSPAARAPFVAPSVAPAPSRPPATAADEAPHVAPSETIEATTAPAAPPAPSAWPETDQARSTSAGSAPADTSWPDSDRKREDQTDNDGVTAARLEVTHGEASEITRPDVPEAPEEETRHAAPVPSTPAVDQAAPALEELDPGDGSPAWSALEEEPSSAVHRILGPAAVVAGATGGAAKDLAAEPQELATASAAPHAPVDAPAPTTAPQPGSPMPGFVKPSLEANAPPAAVRPPSIDAPPLDSSVVSAPPTPTGVPGIPPTAAAPAPPPLASPLRPLPMPPTQHVPGPAPTGPFAAPYQRPADRAHAPAPPPPATQPAYPPPSVDAWGQPTGHGPVQPPVIPAPPSAPGFVMPPSAAAVPPQPSTLPTAAKRTVSQGCTSCGLRLSAKARFCRRCGAAQP